MNPARIDASQVPQVDDLNRVVEYVRTVAQSGSTPEEDGFLGQDRQYYAHAARVLGFLDADGASTDLGRRLLESNHPEFVLVEAFDETPLADAWALTLGASSVWDLDSRSIVEALPRISNLAEPTATRRAEAVAHWHATLLPAARARPTDAQLREDLLARPLSELSLPTRLKNFAARSDLVTVRDLVSLGRAALVATRNLGQRSVADLDAVLRGLGAGDGLDALHACVVRQEGAPSVASKSSDTLPEVLPWDLLAPHVPEALRDTPVVMLSLPTRIANYCARTAMGSLGSLVDLRSAVLLAEPNIGRSSLRDGAAVICAFLRRDHAADGSTTPYVLENYANYQEVLREAMRDLERRKRIVIAGRSGIAGTISTLRELGEVFGIGGERVRQLETQAVEEMLRDARWAVAIADRLNAQLSGQVRPLERLADDAFFAPAIDSEESRRTFAYLLERLVPGDIVLSAWNDGFVVGPKPAQNLDAAYAALLTELGERLPLHRSVVEHEAGVAGERLAEGFGALFVERLGEDLTFDGPTDVALSRSRTKVDRIRAFVLGQAAPVSIHDIYGRFGRVNLSHDFVYVERGFVTHANNIPDFVLWKERLVPQCLRIMAERGPELQWMATDLLDALRETEQLPPYMTPWILAGMLRQSHACADLGRLRFAPNEAGSDARIQFAPAIESILRDAGGPLARNELHRRLERLTTCVDLTFGLAVVRLPMLPIDDERIGLVDRDVPGGRAALEAAGELLEQELERRNVGLTFGEAQSYLAGRSAQFVPFTREIVAAVARAWPSLVSNRVGLGLDAWETARVATRGEVVRRMVDAGDGKASIDAVMAALEAREHAVLPRSIINSLAYQLGLRIEDGKLVDRGTEGRSGALWRDGEIPAKGGCGEAR